MVYDEVYFGGEVLPCVVEEFPVIRKPRRKFTSYNIPGRNGDIIVQQDAYENVIVPYKIYCGEENVQADWTDLAKVLYKDGYQELSDISDTEHFRMGVFNGGIDAAYYWEKVGRTTLEFDCRPERFLLSGKTATEYEEVENSAISLWDREDFSNFLQGQLTNGVDKFWVIKIPSGTSTRYILNMIPTGKSMTWISTNTDPSTASSATSNSSWDYDEIANKEYGSPTVLNNWLIYQQDYFNEIPIVLVDGNPLGGSGTLFNPYMPANPKIILHCTTSTTPEVLAARINGGGIYINDARSQSSNLPYYIIQPNGKYYKSNAENGRIYPAENIRIEGDLTLKSGVNYIYTSTNFEMKIVPNWWEL